MSPMEVRSKQTIGGEKLDMGLANELTLNRSH